MARITHLQLQRRRTDRVNVFLGDEYAFSLALDVAVRLRVDQELGDDEIAALQAEDAYRTALDRALGWLGVRPRSRVEVERYLTGKEVAPDTVNRVIGRLLELGYVDDGAFAAWWVENRSTHRPRGRQMLRHELAQKGVPADVIAAATGDVDEPATAVAVALAHAHRFAGADRATFQRRLGGLLSRRGFGYGAVRDALAEAWRTVVQADRHPDAAGEDDVDAVDG